MQGVMGAGHSHDHGRGGGFEAPQGLRRFVVFALAPLVALTIIGMALTWPDRAALPVIEVGDFVRAQVVATEGHDLVAQPV